MGLGWFLFWKQSLQQINVQMKIHLLLSTSGSGMAFILEAISSANKCTNENYICFSQGPGL